jgi:hypothetical protein
VVAARPYPGQKPWPNPLDAGDAGIDHDSDGLSMGLEYQLNRYAKGPKVGDLQYSDGQQRSENEPAPTEPELDYIDVSNFTEWLDDSLSDDERDADKDGLGNWDEAVGRMTQDWWDKVYNGEDGAPKESRYPNTTFPGVSPFDPDSDGDDPGDKTLLDGADDQDHDGLSNAFEISRPWDWQLTYVSRGHTGQQPPEMYDNFVPPGPLPAGTDPNPWARVQPYNPCKPVWSKTCHLRIPFGYYQNTEDWAGPDPADYPAPPLAPWLYDSDDDPVANGE